MADELHDKIDKANEKLDKMGDTMTVIQLSQARMESDVAYHIQRTNLLEASVVKIQEEQKPVVKDVDNIKSIIKYTAWLVTILLAAAGVIATFYRG